MAPGTRIVLRRQIARLADRQPAMTDAEIERRVDFRIVEFHQHVVAGDAELRRAEGDEGCDVERADADQVEAGDVGGEAQLAGILVGERRFRLDADGAQDGQDFLEDAAFRECQNQSFVGTLAHLRLSRAKHLSRRAGEVQPRRDG